MGLAVGDEGATFICAELLVARTMPDVVGVLAAIHVEVHPAEGVLDGYLS